MSNRPFQRTRATKRLVFPSSVGWRWALNAGVVADAKRPRPQGGG